MSQSSNAVLFTTKGRAAKRGRFVISEAHSVEIQPGERVGVGIVPGKDESALVHEYGAAQTGVPLYAVATAVASGVVVPLDALVSAFAETGQLAELEKAIKAAKAA